MHHHDNPTGHMRPRQVRRILALLWFGAVPAFASALIGCPPKSDASPVSAVCGFGFGSGGGFATTTLSPDGSFMHFRNGRRLGCSAARMSSGPATAGTAGAPPTRSGDSRADGGYLAAHPRVRSLLRVMDTGHVSNNNVWSEAQAFGVASWDTHESCYIPATADRVLRRTIHLLVLEASAARGRTGWSAFATSTATRLTNRLVNLAYGNEPREYP